MPKIARTVILRTRVTPDELAKIERAATKLNYSVSELLRVAAIMFAEGGRKK